ncbi:MAG TPA: ComF family protein [Terracidiphilus sp.]|nr:ComF family protein [Terracidiphilus sp.]
MAVQATAVRVRCVFRKGPAPETLGLPPSEISRWRAVSRVLRSPLDALSCTILPADCSLCGSPLPRLSSAPICAACWSEVPVQSGPTCARCGDSLDRPVPVGNLDPVLCRTCRLAPPPFVKAVAYGRYEGRMRELIHAFKYHGLRPAARQLGLLLARSIASLAQEAPGGLLVVPVPLHRAKHAERGFNQARLLAVEAIAALRKQHPEWHLTLAPTSLMRLRPTESQAGLTPRQRRLNLRGAFGVSDPSVVMQQRVLVVDDIFTTGATARSASRALLEAGAESVWVATLARAHRIDRGGFDRSLVASPDALAMPVPLQNATMNAQHQPSF